jgi:hypothetical protein
MECRQGLRKNLPRAEERMRDGKQFNHHLNGIGVGTISKRGKAEGHILRATLFAPKVVRITQNCRKKRGTRG